MRDASVPSPKVEDYLQAIYSLETEGERIISARLSRWMRVTPPTAWATVRRMARDGLVSVDVKKTIHLTKRGRDLAEKVARRHRLSERFLNDVLGLGWAEAHDEAQAVALSRPAWRAPRTGDHGGREGTVDWTDRHQHRPGSSFPRLERRGPHPGSPRSETLRREGPASRRLAQLLLETKCDPRCHYIERVSRDLPVVLLIICIPNGL